LAPKKKIGKICHTEATTLNRNPKRSRMSYFPRPEMRHPGMAGLYYIGRDFFKKPDSRTVRFSLAGLLLLTTFKAGACFAAERSYRPGQKHGPHTGSRCCPMSRAASTVTSLPVFSGVTRAGG
jgi:hypothetical protein